MARLGKESKEKGEPGEKSIWGFGLAKEFELLEGTRGPVGNAECCCWVMVSLARLRAAIRSEGAGLDVCEGKTDDAAGSAFTFKGMGTCEGITDDATGSAFTSKGMGASEGTDDVTGSAFTVKGTAASEGEEPIRGEPNSFT